MDTLADVALAVLGSGPGVAIGCFLGWLPALRRVRTIRLCLGIVAGTLLLGAPAVMVWPASLALWANVLLWGTFFAWATRRPPSQGRVPSDIPVGPAGRAFERRRPPSPWS